MNSLLFFALVLGVSAIDAYENKSGYFLLESTDTAYKYSGSPLSLERAEQDCHAQGAELFQNEHSEIEELKNITESDEFKEQVADFGMSWPVIWVGRTGDYLYQYSCVAFNGEFFTMDYGCNTELYYFCMIPREAFEQLEEDGQSHVENLETEDQEAAYKENISDEEESEEYNDVEGNDDTDSKYYVHFGNIEVKSFSRQRKLNALKKILGILENLEIEDQEGEVDEYGDNEDPNDEFESENGEGNEYGDDEHGDDEDSVDEYESENGEGNEYGDDEHGDDEDSVDEYESENGEGNEYGDDEHEDDEDSVDEDESEGYDGENDEGNEYGNDEYETIQTGAIRKRAKSIRVRTTRAISTGPIKTGTMSMKAMKTGAMKKKVKSKRAMMMRTVSTGPMRAGMMSMEAMKTGAMRKRAMSTGPMKAGAMKKRAQRATMKRAMGNRKIKTETTRASHII